MLYQRVEGWSFFTIYLLTIPVANWMIGNVGTVCGPHGPCLIPVAPGLMAPSGVLMVGLALVLRDLVQRRLGKVWSIAAIVCGAMLSGLVAPLALVTASSAAFLFSEFADFAVFTPLQTRGLLKAVVAGAVAGSVVDSALFLYLAFGNLDFLLAQVVGKLMMVAASVPLIAWWRRRDERQVQDR